MLKNYLLALTLAGLVSTIAPAALAQNGGTGDQQSAPAGGPPEGGRGHRQFDPAKRSEMLAQKLKLTSDQQAKVLDILKSQQSQMESLHADSSLSRDDRWSKMSEIRKTSDGQIRAILDSTQQKKWDEMQSKREDWQEHRRDGSAPPPDSQQ